MRKSAELAVQGIHGEGLVALRNWGAAILVTIVFCQSCAFNRRFPGISRCRDLEVKERKGRRKEGNVIGTASTREETAISSKGWC